MSKPGKTTTWADVAPALVAVDGVAGPAGPALTAEMGMMPRAFGTAHNLLMRSGVDEGSRVLTIFNGEAVGYAVVRLATTYGAIVAAQCRESAAAPVRAAGATYLREDAVHADGNYDAVIDFSTEGDWRRHLLALRPGGVYATPGAIAAAPRRDETRAVYLNDLTLFGRPHCPQEVFAGLITTITVPRLRAISECYRSKWSEDNV